MFRVDVATMAKPKTLVGRVHSTRMGSSDPTKARILFFLTAEGQALWSPRTRPHLLCKSYLPQPQTPPFSKTPPPTQAPPIPPPARKCQATPSK